MERTHWGQHDPTCFGCKVQSVQWSPSATPSRRNSVPPRPSQNQWEKGVATDSRGMPLLNDKGSAIGLHELASNRSTIERQLRDLKRTPTPTTP